MLTLTRLDARDTPALASAGGDVFRVDPLTGTSTYLFSPFEPAAAGVPVHLAEEAGRILVGAGVGGGPRLQARDAATLRVVWDTFIGNPDSRTGVSLTPGGVLPATPLPIAEGVPSPLRAEPHPTHPGYLPGVQRSLDALPAPLGTALAGAGVRAVVFHGVPVVGLPEFAHLAGVETPSAGDGDTTYESAYAVYSPERRATYLPADADRGTVFHELMHAAFDVLLSEADRAEWYQFHGAAVVSPPWAAYEAGDPRESFAETGRRHLLHLPQPAPAADPLVARLLLG